MSLGNMVRAEMIAIFFLAPMYLILFTRSASRGKRAFFAVAVLFGSWISYLIFVLASEPKRVTSSQ